MSFITSFLSSCKSNVISFSGSFVELFGAKHDHVIRIDARETPKEYVFYAEVPGVEMDDLHVEIIEDDKDYACILVIGIYAKKTIDNEEKIDTLHVVERISGISIRRFMFRENVKKDQLKASLKNGVLTVIVPKMEPKVIEIHG